MAEATSIDRPAPAPLLDNWRRIIATGNLPEGRTMDGVSRWLLITRACVFSMTITSGLVGGLLAAATAAAPNWRLFALALLGLVVAHAANNMINDYFDTTGGVDTSEYTRALYAPHPLLSGLISKRGLIAAIAACNVIDLTILGALTAARGPLVIAFALAGLFVSVFYVAPPLKLKHHGLGEPGVFVVWGPLMIGGTYFVTTGTLPAWVWVASIPYALVVTTVHEVQVVGRGAIPTTPHDIHVDLIATPDGVIACPRPGGHRLPALDWDQLTDDKIAAIPLLARLAASRNG